MHIRISIPAQTLELIDDRGLLLNRYLISTAKNGAGEVSGSFCTPRGRHIIRAKIGGDQAANTVFVRRRPTGEIWTPELAAANPGRDWILTRILWLSGKEPGFNRLGKVDTMRRYIYLHGSPDTVEMGVPGSIGCVRMRNSEIMELFDLVPVCTRVDIVEFSVEDNSWGKLEQPIRSVREAVFIREQHVPPEMEWDDFDQPSRQVIARNADGMPIGTGRLLPDGHIGRMAVLPEWRGKGVGSAIFERLLQLAAACRMPRLMLHAQTHAAGFYTRYGFVRDGAEFIEADIPHVLMQRETMG